MRDFIKIEITGSCNLECKYCFRDKDEDISRGYDYINKVDNILQSLNPKSSVIRIESIGEITLFPDLIKYLENKSRVENYTIEILSNGITADSLIYENSNINWILSIDGHTEKMNKYRGISHQKIENILNVAITSNSELQCVVSDQSIEEINQFITYLRERKYEGFLHLFPCRWDCKSITRPPDYTKLEKASFIADEEYFKRWKYVYDFRKRDFKCDFFINGYTYRISPNEVKKMKCDCSGSSFKVLKLYDTEEKINGTKCGLCINHFEYNNSRRIFNNYERILVEKC